MNKKLSFKQRLHNALNSWRLLKLYYEKSISQK